MSDPRELCDLADIPIEVEDEQETKHTPEPWGACSCGKCAQVHSTAMDCAVATCAYDEADAPSPSLAEALANAARIVACVNGCAGINPEAVPDLIAALQGLVGIIDKAGLLNLSNGVQLGATSWYVKASDRLDFARAALAKAGVE